MNRQHNSKYIFLILHLLCCIFLCQCSNNNQSKDNDRSDYVQRAREQDSLRIAHYQDSVEKVRLATIAQKEREEQLKMQAEQEAIERKRQEEANHQNEILAQKKRIQEKEYRDNLVERIDTVYTNLSKKIAPTMIGLTIIKQRKIK